MPAKIPESKYSDVFWSRVDKCDWVEVCWEWTRARFPDGYGVMKFKGKSTGTHRIAWMLTNGDIPDGMEICHECDNPPCCNPHHLFLGTKDQNQADKANKGRAFRGMGTMQSQSKLTDEDVRLIREKYVYRVYSAARLSKEFGIAESMILRIIHRKNWSHV